MKNKFSVYKLHFTTPVHLGDARDDYSISLKTIQSDMMYAALTACLAKIGITIPEDKVGDLGFTISSLFPFYQKDKDAKAVYFLPKPFNNALPDLKDVEKAKSIKKVSWIDVDEYSDFLCGIANIGQKTDMIEGEYFTGKAIEKKFIFTQVSPRVTVSRTGKEDAKPFYMDKVYFKDYSGLYFIADGEVSLLEIALEVLQHEGIGTDRNVGNGFFTFDKDEFEIDCPNGKDTDYSMSLSMYIPKDENELKHALSGKQVAYDFARRGGWITTAPFNTFRKNAIYAFMPGSVLSLKLDNNIDIMGRIVNLKPKINFEKQKLEHSIWRNGKAFFIPIKL